METPTLVKDASEKIEEKNEVPDQGRNKNPGVFNAGEIESLLLRSRIGEDWLEESDWFLY